MRGGMPAAADRRHRRGAELRQRGRRAELPRARIPRGSADVRRSRSADARASALLNLASGRATVHDWLTFVGSGVAGDIDSFAHVSGTCPEDVERLLYQRSPTRRLMRWADV